MEKVGFLSESPDFWTLSEILEIIKKEQNAADAITRNIEFTRNYQDIGVKSPVWHDLVRQYNDIRSTFHHPSITLHSDLEHVEVYADPLFPLICQNLIDNSLRHGEHVKNIRFKSIEKGEDLILEYCDDGIGIPDSEKEKIFERGYGKNTGMGLFLSREILAITNLVMQETGTFGKGVKFIIIIPKDSYRFQESGIIPE
ncbi:hypothetical protein DLD82_04040 [Methanospirillum stamsii]|uniref:histidine kinase n=1 Tax=Methanospirillum stamsii TaxID=1277351 RepID=A0A2V2N626_9EURY|nr:hypothetical protein DLD82_04040 [Methanospirillum stamsii]